MKSILAVLLPVFCANINAQVVKVTVSDSTTHEPLGYAAVKIHSCGDDTFIAGGSTDEKGEFGFRLEKNYPEVRVSVSFLGYKPSHKTFAPGAGENLIKFEMQEDSRMLDGVVVKGLS